MADVAWNDSAVCTAMVLVGEAQARLGHASGYIAAYHRVQADVCCVPRMYETEADILVSDFLLLDVRPSATIPSALPLANVLCVGAMS